MKISQLTEATSPATTDYVPVNVSSSTKKVSIANLKTAMGVPTYTRYVALLTQSGTSAPTATVLENTLGGTPALSYPTTGEHRFTLSNAFTANKTIVFITTGEQTSWPGVFVNWKRTSANVITVYTADQTGAAVDSGLLNASIEIRVYP